MYRWSFPPLASSLWVRRPAATCSEKRIRQPWSGGVVGRGPRHAQHSSKRPYKLPGKREPMRPRAPVRTAPETLSTSSATAEHTCRFATPSPTHRPTVRLPASRWSCCSWPSSSRRRGRSRPGRAASPIRSCGITLEILGWQHNKPFNQEMKRWRMRLLPNKPQTHVEYPPNCGSTFRFSITQAPVFAGIARTGRRLIELPDNLRPLIKQRGTELSEPNLRFCNHDGTGFVTDPHPIRGLVRNRPFDHSLTRHRYPFCRCISETTTGNRSAVSRS